MRRALAFTLIGAIAIAACEATPTPSPSPSPTPTLPTSVPSSRGVAGRRAPDHRRTPHPADRARVLLLDVEHRGPGVPAARRTSRSSGAAPLQRDLPVRRLVRAGPGPGFGAVRRLRRRPDDHVPPGRGDVPRRHRADRRRRRLHLRARTPPSGLPVRLRRVRRRHARVGHGARRADRGVPAEAAGRDVPDARPAAAS